MQAITPAAVFEVVKNPVYMPVYAEMTQVALPVETLRQQINRIASTHLIATSTLYNLAQSESNLNPRAISPDGFDRGIVQINRKFHPEITDEQAFDPEFALNFAAEAISQKKESEWSVCNCVSFVKAMGVKIPRIIDAGNLDSNSKVPIKGGVIILDYHGIHHLAYIDSVESDGIHIKEANFIHCSLGKRVIDLSDEHIVGFFTDKT